MILCPHCDQQHIEGTDYCPRTGQPLVDVSTRMIGRIIAGKYRLLSCIGQGGMGTIFEAEHVLIGNRAAVKMLHEPFAASKEPVQRLYREARATGAIGHPNIIKVYDVGETDDGIPFLVMELLEGESLGAYLERVGPTSIGFALEIAIQMLSGLTAAHDAGVIHRDLKSDNVFLLRNDEEKTKAKLLDFGVSKFSDSDMDSLKLTRTGAVLGTPYYMSPEQAKGFKDLDHRIDIYAVGVIMYEALLGVVPHRATNYNALLLEIITKDAESMGRQRTDIPRDLTGAVHKALARDREDRWSCASDFATCLETIREGLTAVQLQGDAEFNLRHSSPGLSSVTIDSGTLAENPEGKKTFSESTPMTLPKKNRGMLIFGCAAAALIGVIMVAAGNEWGEEPDATTVAQKPAVQEVQDTVHQEIVEPDTKTMVRLLVDVEPSFASVTIAGESVPSTGLELPLGNDKMVIDVSAQGFKAKQIEFVPDQDHELLVSLEKVPQSDRKPRLPKIRSNKKNKAADNQKNSLDRPMDNPF